MYDAVQDPYCYEGASILKNIPGIRDQLALDEFEAAITKQRADEPLPPGRLSVSHYQAVHRHLFQDVYSWAGRFRTVRIGKDGSAFCYPENIEREIKQLFLILKGKRYFRGIDRDALITEATAFLSTLNAIHPFQEGNGRTQTIFLTLIAAQAGHPFDLDKLDPDAFLSAMVSSFKGDEHPLEQQLRLLMPSE
jgi:cell filamentation protein